MAGALGGFAQGFSSGYGAGNKRKAKAETKTETEAIPIPEEKPKDSGFETVVPDLTENKGYSQR